MGQGPQRLARLCIAPRWACLGGAVSARIQIGLCLAVSLSFILALMAVVYVALPVVAVVVLVMKLAEGGGVDPHSHH